jgi:hypothetical protein
MVGRRYASLAVAASRALLYWKRPDPEGGYAMIGLLAVKPLLLLGGVGYLGYRIFYRPIRSCLDAWRDGKSAGSGGIDMKRCPECNTYIRGDAVRCPSCSGKADRPPSPG